MENTNKKSKKSVIVDIIVVVVLLAIIGALVAFVVNSFKKINDASDSVFNNIMNIDDTKITFAEGEITYGLRQNKELGFNLMVIDTHNLKPNTKYKVIWSLKDTYESCNFDFNYKEADGVQKPFIYSTVTSNRSNGYENTFVPANSVNPSSLLSNELYFTTNAEGYFEMGFFIADYVEDYDLCNEQMLAFGALINYIEIVEV